MKYTRCERLLLVKAFFFVFVVAFRHLKITLDSELPMLNISKEVCIFLRIVHLICELILCPVLRLLSPY